MLTVMAVLRRIKSQAEIIQRQHQRLTQLIRYARSSSPFYQQRYQHLPSSIKSLTELPPVTKSQLMQNFDSWVTDRQITKNQVDKFVANKSLVGQLFLGKYAIYTTSGTTGIPGIFLHDQKALAVYNALLLARELASWINPFIVLAQVQVKTIAAIVATEGHFAGVTGLELARRQYPLIYRNLHLLSTQLPLPKLVKILNKLQPALLLGYPTVMVLLAKEQQQGRLRIRPILIGTAGELISASVRNQVAQVFHCPAYDAYATSEFFSVAYSCNQDWLHVNSDWVILEPVTRDYQPVSVGQPSETVLLTNLANLVAPLIRYDLGDSVTMEAGHCHCGNFLPAIKVASRQADILYFKSTNGDKIAILPMAIEAVVEEIAGVEKFQLVQTSPTRLVVRLEVTKDFAKQSVWQEVKSKLQSYLQAQGLKTVRVERSAKPPRRDPKTGKFRQVFAQK